MNTGMNLVGSAALISLLALASIKDARSGRIPDPITLGGMLLGLSLGLWRADFAGSIVGILVGGGLAYSFGRVGFFVSKKEILGTGDIKLVAMIGSFLGWHGVLLVFFTAPFLALPYGLYRQWKGRQDKIPYAPFLSIAVLIYLFTVLPLINK